MDSSHPRMSCFFLHKCRSLRVTKGGRSDVKKNVIQVWFGRFIIFQLDGISYNIISVPIHIYVCYMGKLWDWYCWSRVACFVSFLILLKNDCGVRYEFFVGCCSLYSFLVMSYPFCMGVAIDVLFVSSILNIYIDTTLSIPLYISTATRHTILCTFQSSISSNTTRWWNNGHPQE